MQELTINRLPQLTWNHLRVNQATIRCPKELPVLNAVWKLPDGSGAVLTQENTDSLPEGGLGVDALSRFTRADVLTLPADTRCESSLTAVLDGGAGAFQLVIRANKNSDYRLTILLTGSGDGVNALRIVPCLAEGARLHIGVAQLLGGEMVSLQDIAGDVDKNASLTVTQLELGAKSIFVGNRVLLSGHHSRYDADMGYRLMSQRLDVNIIARHLGAHSESRMDAVGVLDENGVKCFRDTLDFVRGSHGAAGSETEDVLMLGEEVVNQSVPLILCDEEDVDGTHGASIGRLDEAMLYYMGSRGISPAEARRIMAAARMRAVADKLPADDVREAAMRFLSDALKEETDA